MLAARPLKAASLFLCLRLYFLAFNILWNGSNKIKCDVCYTISTKFYNVLEIILIKLSDRCFIM